MKYQLVHLDTCLPDYFSGYHKPVLPIFVDGSTTADEFIESIVADYSLLWDYLTMEFADDKTDAWPDLSNGELKQLAKDLLVVSGNEIVFPDLEVRPDDVDDYIEYDDCVCHLTIEEV